MLRRPLPRRALLAATLGALYGLLILPTPDSLLGVSMLGVAWFVLSASLLFVHPVAYHAFVFWGILWVVWRGIGHARSGEGAVGIALDLVLPVASLALLMMSGYMRAAQAARGD